jgi:hypothetical protein
LSSRTVVSRIVDIIIQVTAREGKFHPPKYWQQSEGRKEAPHHLAIVVVGDSKSALPENFLAFQIRISLYLIDIIPL